MKLLHYLKYFLFHGVAIGAIAGHSRGKALRPTRLPPTHAWLAGASATGCWAHK